MYTNVVVTEVVMFGRGLGGTAFSEQAALTTLGSKVCRITGVVMVRRPVAVALLEADDGVALIIMAVVVKSAAAAAAALLLNAAVT